MHPKTVDKTYSCFDEDDLKAKVVGIWNYRSVACWRADYHVQEKLEKEVEELKQKSTQRKEEARLREEQANEGLNKLANEADVSMDAIERGQEPVLVS